MRIYGPCDRGMWVRALSWNGRPICPCGCNMRPFTGGKQQQLFFPFGSPWKTCWQETLHILPGSVPGIFCISSRNLIWRAMDTPGSSVTPGLKTSRAVGSLGTTTRPCSSDSVARPAAFAAFWTCKMLEDQDPSIQWLASNMLHNS